MQKLELKEFKQLLEKNTIVVDTRPSTEFAEGFIEKSLSAPFNENFLQTLYELVDSEQKIVLIVQEAEAKSISDIVRNAALTNVVGFLDGGYEQWKKSGGKINMLITIEPDEFAIDYQFDEFYLVDVRSKEEFEKEHVEDSENISLDDLQQMVLELDAQQSYYVYADSLDGAITAGSLFKRYGVERIRAIAALYTEIHASGVPLVKQKKKDKTSQNYPDSGMSKN